MIKAAKIDIKAGNSVIFDATNPKRENRAKIITLANEYNLPTRCILFKTTIEDAMTWNTKRMNETNKKVPNIAFYLFRKNYEEPMSDEKFLIHVVNDSANLLRK
jgi:predicted kinase